MHERVCHCRGKELDQRTFSRDIEKIEVMQTGPPGRVDFQPILGQFDFYDVEIVAPSFFRHQVLEDVLEVLQHSSLMRVCLQNSFDCRYAVWWGLVYRWPKG